jgi:E3 ubiquitin-protein ligase MARCH6
MGLKVKAGMHGVHFSGLLVTMTGYCMIGISLALLHAFASLLRFRRSARALGLCYVVVKVALLLVAEILAFPVICGWWLDICSLSLFDATLKDR